MSRPFRILVLEDDPIVSMDMEAIVADAVDAVVDVTASLAEVERLIGEPVDLALLDVEVADGRSYGVAARLRARNTPVIFVTGSRPEDVPPALAGTPLIGKPYSACVIARVVRDTLGVEG
jgi:CheY-like chemotaxis protein